MQQRSHDAHRSVDAIRILHESLYENSSAIPAGELVRLACAERDAVHCDLVLAQEEIARLRSVERDHGSCHTIISDLRSRVAYLNFKTNYFLRRLKTREGERDAAYADLMSKERELAEMKKHNETVWRVMQSAETTSGGPQIPQPPPVPKNVWGL